MILLSLIDTPIKKPHTRLVPGMRFFWCRWWDSNPHGIATKGFWVLLVYHSNTPAYSIFAPPRTKFRILEGSRNARRDIRSIIRYVKWKTPEYTTQTQLTYLHFESTTSTNSITPAATRVLYTIIPQISRGNFCRCAYFAFLLRTAADVGRS